MSDKDSKKRAIDHNLTYSERLDDEDNKAGEDEDMDTQKVIRRLKVRELKKLADESDKLDLEEAVEVQRARVRDLKAQKKVTKVPNYVEAEDDSPQTNFKSEILSPDSLKILKDMDPKDRDSLIRSVSMVTQSTGGRGMNSIIPLMLEAQKNVGSKGGDMDVVKAAKDLLEMYWKGRDEASKEHEAALSPALPEGFTVPAPEKGFLEEIMDDEVKTFMKDAFKKVLSGKTETVAAAPQVGSVSDQPIRMVPDPERPGHYFPEIIPNLEEYYKLEDRREEHIKKKTDEEKSVKRDDRIFDEVIKPLVKSGTKMIDEEVKKLRGGGAQSSEKSSASEDAKTTSPPQEQSFPCPDTEKCKGTITIKAVNGKWPETATCPTCKQSWKPQE